MGNERQRVLHYRTTGTTSPLTNDLLVGEIAISTDNEWPRLFIRKNNGDIAEFVDSSVLIEDERVIAESINFLNDSLSGKQDTLVSGENIKTINGMSILGSGNTQIVMPEINDNIISSTALWSSEKTNQELSSLSANLITELVDDEKAIAETFKLVENKIDTKQEKLTAGDGIIISASTISSYNTSDYIKNYATQAEYNADTTRQTPNVCYIEETDELIYNNN